MIDEYLTLNGFGAPMKTIENYEIRESAADHLRLGRAAKWRYLVSSVPPGLSTLEAQTALLRYLAEKGAERFGFTDIPDDVDERWLLTEWSDPPSFKAFGLPAHQYGVCLIFPRPANASDPIATVRCGLCRTTTSIAMPEFVPIPSSVGNWLLRWPWHGGPVTGVCATCQPMADLFEGLHTMLGAQRP